MGLFGEHGCLCSLFVHHMFAWECSKFTVASGALFLFSRTTHTLPLFQYSILLSGSAMDMSIIILVTGESCAGKDYCANLWASALSSKGYSSVCASISDVTKKEYATATGTDLQRLLEDRSYKEQHRPALSDFYKGQLRKRPRLPSEHFLEVVKDAGHPDVLFITGMRDDAPVATFSPLVPGRRVLEVRVEASKESREARGACGKTDELRDLSLPDFIHRNNQILGASKEYFEPITKTFAFNQFLPLISDEMKQLASMVRSVSGFPTPGITFRHVLGIVQQPGGLSLCVKLMKEQMRAGGIELADLVVSCETGGFLFASALSECLLGDSKVVLIRKPGKLPPPLISVSRSSSHISSRLHPAAGKGLLEWILALPQILHQRLSSMAYGPGEDRFEMAKGVIPQRAKVIVVDDALATGSTLCAVLGLLVKAGVETKDIHVVVVAEFPAHSGRALLLQRGFGMVRVQSLLVFDGA